MTRLRSIAILTTALALLAMPAMVAAADLSATGTMTGLAFTQPAEPGVAECIPNASPVDPEDFVCDFDSEGTFDLGEVGTGTFSGELRLDWSIYTGAEPCAEATGTLTLTTADGTLDLTVDDASRVCETADPMEHAATFDVTVVSGTGVFAGASGTLSATGTMTPSAGSGEYDTAFDVAGTVTVPDPTPTPTPTPAPTDDAAPTATASATPPAALPDTAVGNGSPTTGLVLALAVTFIVSLGATAAARRRI